MSEDSERTVFILSGQPGRVASVIQYLKNRDWDPYCFTDLREALNKILEKRPKYILLSVDFPHPKVRSLPQMLAQAADTEVVLFAEVQSVTAYTLIQSLNPSYSVLPPASGPAVERTLLRIQRDTEARLKTQELGHSYQPTRNWAKNVEEDKSPPSASRSNSSDQKKDPDHRIISGKASAVPTFTQTSVERDEYRVDYEEADSNFKAYGVPELEGNMPAESDQSSSQKEGEGLPQPTLASTSSENKIPITRTQTKKVPTFVSYPDKSTPPPKHHSFQRPPAGSKSPALSESPVQKTPKPRGTFEEEPSMQELLPESGDNSIIALGTELALQESANQTTKLDGSFGEVDECSSVFCIVVESPRFSGYLIAAVGSDRSFDESFVEIVKQRLLQFLRSNGEDPSTEETLKLNIKCVQFEDWALDCADFLRKSVHDGEEIAMAFFPREIAALELPESAHKDMLSLDITNLESDLPLQFNAYIYLPKNAKFILYTGKDRVLMGQQKSRLINKGVTHMYIHKDEADGVKQYCAQNYLNSKITEYEEKQVKKKEDENKERGKKSKTNSATADSKKNPKKKSAA